MQKQDITPEEMTAVCGRMVACRAADYLGITLNRFYHLANRYSLKTAFVYKKWNKDDDHLLLLMVEAEMPMKQIAESLNRSYESVKSRLRTLRRLSRNSK
ncbi:TPA: sigma-70 family RNA polymerase sigma factor [Escherichia coli]